MNNVYVVLSQTGTVISRAIRRFTHDPYNHASICFESDIAKMYSFGRKTRYNIFNNGLIEEGLDKGLFPCFPLSRCLILEIPVTDGEYSAMKNFVQRCYENRDCFRYNAIGLLSYPFGRGLGRDNHYFCSQFVSEVLSHASFWKREPKLTRPMDFCDIANKRVLYEGLIRAFLNGAGETATALRPVDANL